MQGHNNQVNFQGGNGFAGGQRLSADDAKKMMQDHLRNKVMQIDEHDKNVWELITVKSMPQVSKPVAVIQAIFNFFVPGVGTWIAACADSGNSVSKVHILIGLFQFLTSVLIVGWVWAIYWSFLIAKNSWNPQYSPINQEQQNFRGANQNQPDLGGGYQNNMGPGGNRGGPGGPMMNNNMGGQTYNQYS